MKFWKVLSAAALVAGLAPYKVEKDEASGKTTYQSLLMRITTAPGEGEDKKQIAVDLGEGTLFQKAREKAVEREEAHLFTDDLAVTYHEPTEAAEAEIKAMEAEAEAIRAEAEAEAEAAKAEIEAMEAEEEAVRAEAEAIAETAKVEVEAMEAEEEAVRDAAEEAKPEEP